MRLTEFSDDSLGNFDLVSVINWIKSRIKRLDLDPTIPFDDIKKIMLNFDPSFDYDTFANSIENDDTLQTLVDSHDENEITLNLSTADDEDNSETGGSDNADEADDSDLNDLEKDSEDQEDEAEPSEEDEFGEEHRESGEDKVNNLAKRAMDKL